MAIINKIKLFFKNLYKNEYFRVFGIIFILGFVFFGTKALNNGLTMGFSGDYTLQTLAFYSDGYNKIWNFLRTGEFPMFDYSNFLGMNYFGTGSFYYLTSPFYYLLLLCPQKYIFQGVYFLLLIKYAFGGLFFYILLKKFFNYKKSTCLLGAIVYVFSGWNMYYLWFHFADAMAIFPLLLVGIEYFFKTKKGYLMSISLLLIAMCNYFFFVTFAIFGVFYFIFRWISLFGINKKKGYSFANRFEIASKGALYYIIGGLLGGFVLIPSLIVVQQSGRVEDNLMNTFLAFFKNKEMVDNAVVLTGLKPLKEIFSKENLTGLMKFMFVWPERGTNGMTILPKTTLLYIVSSFLYMNVNCWDSAIFTNPGLDNNMGSLFISSFLALLLVPSIIKTIKEKKPFAIFTVILCLALPFLPISFYLFHGFTYEYGRWQICLLVLAIIYTLKTYDDIENIDLVSLSIGAVVNVGLAIYVAIYSYKNGTLDMNHKILVVIAQIILIFVTYHLTFVFHKKKWFSDLAVSMVTVELFASCVITINMHGVTDYNSLYGGKDTYAEEQVLINELKENDDDFYRIYNNMATRNYTNLPNALSYNGMSTFNSIYNKNNEKFIDRSDVWYAGGWSMGYHEKRAYFDNFVGVKYYIVDKNNLNNDTSYDGKKYEGSTALIAKQDYNVNVPFGYQKLDTKYENFDIYENMNFNELGHVYDTYIEDNRVYGSENGYYETLYTQAAIIDDSNEKDVLDGIENFKKLENYSNPFSKVTNMQLVKTISMRNDFSDDRSKREQFEVNSHRDLVTTIQNNYGQYGAMMHGRWQDLGYFGDQIILTLKPGNTIAKDATVNNPAHVVVKMQMGPQALISLYGENDKLLVQDCHMYHNYAISTKNYERKMERGFYVNEEVKKIVIEFINDAKISTDSWNSMFSLDDINVSYRYYNDYLKDLMFTKENALKNIESTINTFKFDTTYDASKIVCLNVPFDDGWTLKMDDEKVDIIKMNGGFIGFIAPSGEHSYFLSYTTPGLKTGALISLGGLGLGGLTFVVFHYKLIFSYVGAAYQELFFVKKRKKEENKTNEEASSDDVIEVKENKVNPTRFIEISSLIIKYTLTILIAMLGIKINPKLAYIFIVLGVIIGHGSKLGLDFLFTKINGKENINKNIKLIGAELIVFVVIFAILALLKIYPLFNLIASSALSMLLVKLFKNEIVK